MNGWTGLGCGGARLLEARTTPDSPWVSIVLVSLAAILLVVSGLRNRPSLGILPTVALIMIAARQGLTSLAQMGLVSPQDWVGTVALGLLMGTGLSLLSIIVIQPLIENLTHRPHDVRIAEGVRGNWRALLSWLVVTWTVVAFGEEVIFRGFLMSQLVKALGAGSFALFGNVLFTSIVFGLSHSYQGRSGAWSTGIIGACLGLLYVLAGFYLWLPILVHGVINTVELILMSRGVDKRLKGLVWRRPLQTAG